MMSHPKIIAVDFDGCLVTNNFPEVGEPILATIEALRREQEQGAKVILWTCRVGEREADAVAWCTRQGIRLDAVNSNLPEMIEFFGNDTRKVFANEYWDDRAVRMSVTDAEVTEVQALRAAIDVTASAAARLDVRTSEVGNMGCPQGHMGLPGVTGGSGESWDEQLAQLEMIRAVLQRISGKMKWYASELEYMRERLIERVGEDE